MPWGYALQHLQHLPQTREAFASGQLSYSKARAITRIGTVDNEEYLLSFARFGTASQSLESASTNANTADRYQVVVHVDSEVLAGEVQAKPTGEPDCYIEKQVGLPVESVRRLSCSCKIVPVLTKGSEPLSIGRSSRAVSTGIRRAINIRDGQCMFPGCDCNKFLDAHHIVHWSNGGETSMENLIEVCHYHHVQLHEGGYSVHRLATGELQFFKPDGTVLSKTLTPLKSDDSLKLSTEAVWHSNGDSMDYDVAVTGIAAKERLS